MIGVWAAMVMQGAAVLVGLVLTLRGTDSASRAVAGDLVFFAVVGLLVTMAIVVSSAVILDAAMLAALLGILATIALARIITRGRR